MILPVRSLPLLMLFFCLACASGAAAQSLVTVKPGPATTAWWLRADFHALDRDIRGIPVGEIGKDWCRASEFTRAKFPPNTLVENGADLMKEANLTFSLEGSFDGSGAKQTALVGTYETCKGEKGRFFLILDSGTRKVRFLDAQIAKERFSALAKAGREIAIFYCLECDITATVRWDRGKKRFVVR